MHDLRRTAGTLMSRAGADSDIAERCLGHIIGGVRGVYDRREYAKEKQRPIRRSRSWSTASWSRRPRT
jgi:integrase